MKRTMFVSFVLAFLITSSASFANSAIPTSQSSLIGTWIIFGGETKPTYPQTFKPVRFTFKRNGKVDMRYLPDPPPMISMLSRAMQEQALAARSLTFYFVDKGDGVEMVDNQGVLEAFKYELRGENLLILHMPPPLGSHALVFQRDKNRF